MILLDTDVLSATRRPERAAPVVAWLRRQVHDGLFISVISLGEVERGIARQEDDNPGFAADLRAWLQAVMARFHGRTLDFGLDDARAWGGISARLGRDDVDTMIAATALTRGLDVATRNVAHFRPTGVRVVNPFEG